MPDLLGERLNEFARWLIAGWDDPVGRVVEVAACVVLLILVFALAAAIEAQDRERQVKKAPGASNLAISTKAHYPRGTVYVPLELGNVTIDLQPGLTDILHVAVGGTSRLGKSSALMPLYDVPIGILTVALDDTVPIARKVRSLPEGVEWTSDPNSPIGLDLLKGTPRVVAEVLVGGFGTIASGKWQRIARDRLWQAIASLDRKGQPRSFEALCAALMVPIPGDGEGTRACQDWSRRLMVLARTLGPALGPELDLVDAMRHQRKVLLRMNRFLSPMDAPMLGGMLLVHARMVAAEAGVPFVLVVEEAGQMKQYQQEIAPLCQAGGARGVSVVLVTQNMSLLPAEVVNNISVWVSFAQEERDDIAFAAHKLRLKPEQVYREAFPGKGDTQGRGWCYVRAPGVPTTLVRIERQEPKEPRVRRPPILVPASVPAFEEMLMLDEPILEEPKKELPAWVGTDPDRVNIAVRLERDNEPSLLWHPEKGFWQDGPCLLWTGAHTEGRPKAKFQGRSIIVYIETFQWAGGKIPESFTCDHLCAKTLCCEPGHLEPVTIAENNKRRSARKKALAALVA